MSIQTTGVVDRISEGTYAVIIAEDIHKEFTLNIKTIDISLREGLWLDLTINDQGELTKVCANEALTKEKSAAISNTLAKLKKRKGSKYKS